MARHRIKKYSRRTRSQYKKSKAPIVLAVIAFLLLAAVISVAVGLSLAHREEDVGGPTKKFDLEREDYVSGNKLVSAVDAYNFSKGANAADYIAQDIPDLSVCVRHEDGRLDYKMEAAELYSADIQGDGDLYSLCSAAHSAGGRVCAYIYITSFEINDTYSRKLAKAYELALISELARAGADDILLLGIPVSEENIGEVEDFVAEASVASDKAPLGVSVDETLLALSAEGAYLAPRLREACDYLALDLTHLAVSDGNSQGIGEDGEPMPGKLELAIRQNHYYIKSYPMRLLFSVEESKLHASAQSMGVFDMQTVGK